MEFKGKQSPVAVLRTPSPPYALLAQWNEPPWLWLSLLLTATITIAIVITIKLYYYYYYYYC